MIDNKTLHERYGVPVRTLQNWTKDESWRGDLLNQLREYAEIEQIQLEDIKARFTPRELQALIACINSTMPQKEFYTTNYWQIHFSDCCAYESMQVMQFVPEGTDLDQFRKNVLSKLNGLDLFGRYVLFRYTLGFWEQHEDIQAYTSAS